MIDPYPDLRRATRDGTKPFPEALSPTPADNFFGRLSLERACQIRDGHQEEVVAPAESLALFELLADSVGQRLKDTALSPVEQERSCGLLLEEYATRLPSIDLVEAASERICSQLKGTPL